MIEPWFDPNAYSWIPGTALGVIAGTWGGLVGMLAPRGKAKGLMIGACWLLLAASAAMLAAGLFALYCKQPYGVWYGLLLPGIIGPIVIGCNMPMVYRHYHEAEKRRMEAEDLSM
jgi:hypothetical protein